MENSVYFANCLHLCSILHCYCYFLSEEHIEVSGKNLTLPYISVPYTRYCILRPDLHSLYGSCTEIKVSYAGIVYSSI